MATIIGKNGKPTNKSEKGTPKVDITKTDAVVCSCGDSVFIPAMAFRSLSPLHSGTGKTEYIPVEIFTCASCGSILKELLPPGLEIED